MTGQIKTPYYIIHEDKLRRNLELISHVSEQSGAKIIMAFKANALWKNVWNHTRLLPGVDSQLAQRDAPVA